MVLCGSSQGVCETLALSASPHSGTSGSDVACRRVGSLARLSGRAVTSDSDDVNGGRGQSDGQTAAVGAVTRPGQPKSELAILSLINKAVRRLGWGVVDQAVSSLTNFAVSIYVVRSLGAAQFGAFSLAYITYGFALNVSRGLSTDPLMVRYSGVPKRTWRQGVVSATGTALVVGLVTGVCCMLAAMVLGGTSRAAFTALGLTMPGLLLQDSWRFSFFADGRGVQAFLNDSIWAVTLLPALALLRMTGRANVFWFVLAWGLTACIAAVGGILQARVIPSPINAWYWLHRQRDLGPRYVLEGTSGSVLMQIRGYGIGLILGLAAVGYAQASITLQGPMTILSLGMGLVTIPEAARVLRRSPRKLPLFCILVSAGLSMAGLAWGIALFIAIPRGLGALMLHDNWRPIYPLVVPQILWIIGGTLAAGAGCGLHGLGAARQSLRVVLITGPIAGVTTVAGAAVAGLSGSIYGLALGSWMSALLTWIAFYKAFREYEESVDANRSWHSRGKHRRRK